MAVSKYLKYFWFFYEVKQYVNIEVTFRVITSSLTILLHFAAIFITFLR